MILGKIIPGRRSKKLMMCEDQKRGHLAGMSGAFVKYKSDGGLKAKVKSLDNK